MAVVENRFVCDLAKPVQAQALKGNVFSLDNLGSRISVLIYDNGQPATISGSVTANCILPDGSTVNVNGSLTTENGGSKAYVDIPQSCLLIPGILKIAIKCTSSSVITTLAAIVANVYMTKTDNVITPSAQIISDWNAEISSAIASQNAIIATGLYEHTRLNSSTDLNDLKARGTYYWNASSVPLNAPDNQEQTTLIVIEGLDTACVTQIAYNKANMYWRRYQSSAWTSWVQVALDSDLYVKLAGMAQEVIAIYSDKPDTPYSPVYSLIEKKRNKTNLTTDNNNNNSITTLIPVFPGHMITAVTTTNATDTAIITVYNKNKVAESYVNSGTSTSNTFLISYLNSDAELKYVSVCGLSASDITVRGYAPVKQFGNLLLRKQGMYYKLDNTVAKVRFDSGWHVSDYVCSTPIKLNEGDIIHAYVRASTSIAAIIKCDQYGGNRTFVVNGNNVTQYDYIAPEDCWVMVQYKESDTFNIINVIPKAHRWNYNGDKNDTRHPTVCFTYDDGTARDADLVSVFDSYGLKCGFALPSSIVVDARCGEYLDYQNRGFSILSHSTSLSDGGSIFWNPETNVETIKNKLLQSKQQLMRSGFDIRGWVTPQSRMYSSFIQYLNNLYDYGYTVLYPNNDSDDPNDNKYVPGGSRPENRFSDSPYGLWRITQFTLTENCLAAIDQCIANKGFLTFYFHAADLTDAHIERLQAILSYVNEKIATYNLKCLAPNEAFDYYFNIRRQDIVS